MTSRQRTGKRGEGIARRHLEGLGYSVIETNYRVGRGEIDLIVERNGTLVFVEVRTRKGGGMGTPEESITPAKQIRMVEAAERYIQQKDTGAFGDWRIDLVAIELDRKSMPVRVEVIENAIEL